MQSAIKPLKHYCGCYMAKNYCWQMPKLQNLGGMCQVKWPEIHKKKRKIELQNSTLEMQSPKNELDIPI